MLAGVIFLCRSAFSWGSDVDTVCRVVVMLACFSRDHDTGAFFNVATTQNRSSV